MDMTIGSLAKRAKVNLQTLRYYEQCGLLVPIRRAASGYRLYNEESLQRLKFIRHSQVFGFSLKEIDRLLKLDLHSSSACQKARRMVEAKILQIGHEIERLTHRSKSLEGLMAERGHKPKKGPCPLLIRLYGQGGGLEKK